MAGSSPAGCTLLCMAISTGTDDAYALLGTAYDAWCRSVTEDIPWYVDLALESGGPVLEVGVGSGRIAIPTALAGVPVVGVDASPVMLDLARARAGAHGLPQLRLVQADMRELPDLGCFALATVPFRTLLHLHDNRDRKRVLHDLRSRLAPGGRLAFDVFHPDRRDIDETHGRWLEREPGISERATWRPQEGRLTLEVRAGGRRAEMELAWLEPTVWRRLLESAGYRDIRSYGWFDGRPLAPGSTDSVWVAER